MSSTTFDSKAFRQFEAAGWSNAANQYHQFFDPVIARSLDSLLDAAKVGQGVDVLDVACGPGYVAAQAAARGASVVGIDVAPGMVELARRLYPVLEFRQADAEELPFANERFGAVVGSMVLPHLTRHAQAAAEWARILRPGGYLAQVMWAPPDQTRLIGVMTDAIQVVRPTPPPDLPPGPPFFLYASDAMLTELFVGAGLTDVIVQSLSFTHLVPDTDTLWASLLGATVRTAPVILRQSPEVQQQIRAAFDKLATEYATVEGLKLPVGVKVVSGRKPLAAM